MKHGSDDERNLFGPPPEEMLAELQRLAPRLDVEVRNESTDGRVGRCLLHGRWIAMLEKSLPLCDKVEGLARALADLDYENVYLSPACRDLLESYRSRMP